MSQPVSCAGCTRRTGCAAHDRAVQRRRLGGFFTARRRRAPRTPEDLDDNPTPSGNAMLAFVLLRFARIWGGDRLERRMNRRVPGSSATSSRALLGLWVGPLCARPIPLAAAGSRSSVVRPARSRVPRCGLDATAVVALDRQTTPSWQASSRRRPPGDPVRAVSLSRPGHGASLLWKLPVLPMGRMRLRILNFVVVMICRATAAAAPPCGPCGPVTPCCEPRRPPRNVSPAIANV